MSDKLSDEGLLNELNRMRLALQLILLSMHVDDKPELTRWIDKRKRKAVVKKEERDNVEKLSEQAYQQIVQIIKLHFSDEWQQVKKDLGKFMQEQKPEITEALIEEKARELFEKGILYHKDTENQAILPLDWCKDFIRKLYEEMPARKATVSEEEIYQHGIRMTIRHMDDLMKAWQKYRGTKTLGEFAIEFLEQFRREAGVEVKE